MVPRSVEIEKCRKLHFTYLTIYQNALRIPEVTGKVYSAQMPNIQKISVDFYQCTMCVVSIFEEKFRIRGDSY